MEESANKVAVKEPRVLGPKSELTLQSDLRRITITGADSPPTQK